MSLMMRVGDRFACEDFCRRLAVRGIGPWHQERQGLTLEIVDRLDAAQATAEYILEYKSRRLLAGMLRRQLHAKDVSEDTLADLVEEAVSLITWPRDTRAWMRWENYCKVVRRRLLPYFFEEEQLNLDGFIRFRLPELWAGLAGAAQAVADEFLWGKEYQDFVCLLHAFADRQPLKMGLLHVFLQADGDFLLLDEDKNKVEPQGFCEILPLRESEKVRQDDLLVSTILTLSPERLLLHIRQMVEPPAAQLLHDIFAGKVEFCPGCEICHALLDKGE